MLQLADFGPSKTHPPQAEACATRTDGLNRPAPSGAKKPS
jgi:hypothetical protein